MNKKEILYFTVMGSIIVLYVLLQAIGPKPINWSESYSALDKIPYGAYILKEESPRLTVKNKVLVNNQPLFVSLNNEFNSPNERYNWIFINSELGFDRFETEMLLNRVAEGDYVFMAASTFNLALADTLNLKADLAYSPWDSSITNFNVQSVDTFALAFTNPTFDTTKVWKYPKLIRRYLTSVDSSSATILGIDEKNLANFAKIDFGEGALFVHANPAVFTNFFMRDVSYAEYAFTALSYLPAGNTLIWDEYYKDGRRYENSPIKYVLADKTLSTAWYITMFGIVAFMIFRGKRKQRIIPVIKPPVNSSIEFAKTIGDLYLEKGTHTTIAIKRIDFFLEYIRSNLGLETHKVDDKFLNNVAKRSGINIQEIDALFSLFAEIRQAKNISADTLKLLTQRIDRFYNQSKR